MRARPPRSYEENMKMFGELRLVRAITEEQIAAMRDPSLVPDTKLPRIEDAVKAGGFLAGTPADIIEQLKAVEKRYPGLERVSCTMPLGTPLAMTLEQLERFAKEVMPAFKSTKAAAATMTAMLPSWTESSRSVRRAVPRLDGGIGRDASPKGRMCSKEDST